MYEDDSFLHLSGIQHFAFCPRQWALIYIEQQWEDNVRTVDGSIFHERAHREEMTEKRGDLIITRGLRVRSESLGIQGKCDVVEFHRSRDGISLHGYEGKWRVYPIEYKKGSPKPFDADQLQLCAQALCLEEMLACAIPEGSLFYGEPKRRTRVPFTPELRGRVKDIVLQMHDYFRRGHTSKPKPAQRCRACSLVEICLPTLVKKTPVRDYIRSAMEGEA